MNEYLASRISYYVDSLNRFIKSSHPLMLVMGQEGSGKEELLDRFIRQLPSKYSVLVLSENQQFEPEHLLEAICNQWQFEKDPSLDNQRQQFDHLLLEMAEQRESFILVLKNAHNLSIPTLAAISRLSAKQDAAEVALHIITVGEIELEDKMASLVAQIPPRLLLQPFTKKEASQYIRYRLSKLKEIEPITPSQDMIDDIYQQSNGFPSIINHLIQKWLYQYISEDEKTQLATNKYSIIIPRRRNLYATTPWQKYGVKLISITGLIVLGAGLWIFNHQKMKNSFALFNKLKTTATVSQPVVTAQVTRPVTTPKTPSIPAVTTPHENQQALPVNVMPSAEATPASDNTTSPTIPGKEVAETPQKNAIPISTALKEPVTPSPKKPEAVPAPLNTAAAQAAYTVQLFATRDYDLAKEFINKYKLNTKAEIHQITKGSRSWYAVTIGPYDNYEEAEAVVPSLSSAVQKEGTWVRRLY